MITIIVTLFDPISMFLAVLGAAFARRVWHLLVVALVVTIAVETGVAATHYRSSWGRFFVPHLIASSVHTAVGYAIFRALRRRKIRKLNEKYRMK